MAFRTDLAVEAIENMGKAADVRQVRQTERTLEGFSVSEVEILTDRAAQEIGKPRGRYLTVELDALIRREEDAFPRACRALGTLLRELLPGKAQSGPILVTGLGNRMITPDAIGPQAVDHVIATRHLVEQVPDIFSSWRPVSRARTGVLGQTGVETGEVVCGVLDRIRPAAVLAIDALAAGRLSRLLRTVQLADTGASRPAQAWATRGRPSTSARSAYRSSRWACRPWWTGATLAHEIASQLGGPSCEALEDLSRPVMITTRDIDREVADISRMIGYAVNMALHPHLTVEDIDLYLS